MGKKSVLIIENDVAVRNHLSKKFNNLGMLVITAEEGYEGYTRACNESPNFIVTETLLPNLNGFKVSYLLKHDERYSDIQIALLTSNDINNVTNSNDNINLALDAFDVYRKASTSIITAKSKSMTASSN